MSAPENSPSLAETARNALATVGQLFAGVLLALTGSSLESLVDRSVGRATRALRDDFAALEERTANLRAEAMDALEAAEQKRARAAAYASKAAKSNGDPNGQDSWTLADYRAHLERGGGVIPALEERLGVAPKAAGGDRT